MKRLTRTVLIAVLAMGVPFSVMAMSHEEHGSHGHEKAEEMKHHGDMQHDDEGMKKAHDEAMEHAKEMSHDMHKGHSMSDDDFVEVGKDTRSGVVATVKVKTYDEKTRKTMANMGMGATHHVMVFFADEKTGEEIDSGKAALKVKNASGESGKPVKLMQMGEGFGGDVTIEGAGMVTLEIGTKLEDGKKRQFEVGFHNM